MLSSAALAQALNDIGPALHDALGRRASDVATATRALADLSRLTSSRVLGLLRETASPGALPTAEHDRHPGQLVRWPKRFAGHRQARQWAAEVLSGCLTVAVDGSQLSLADDIDPPVAAAQVGWFVNPHDPSCPHHKDTRMEILVECPGTEGGPAERVDVRRFEMETERLLELMEERSGRHPAPVCFLDDPLIIPFAAERGTGRPEAYIRGISTLLEASEYLRVPLVGYTADPSARDLGRMLLSLGLLDEPLASPDSTFLMPSLERWGDRSCMYICARPSPQLAEYRRSDGSSLADQIAFCYLRVTGHGRPARLEMPRWLAEDDTERERVVDVVRAECIVGLGYPYALEAAHDAAVITAGDRSRFARAFGAYCAARGVSVNPTAKGAGKRRHRQGG